MKLTANIQSMIDVQNVIERTREGRERVHAEAVALVAATRERIAQLPSVEAELQSRLRGLLRERAANAAAVLAGEVEDAIDEALVAKIAKLERRLALVPLALESLTGQQKQQRLAANRLVRD